MPVKISRDEARAGRGGKRHAGHRIPQHVDAERHRDFVANLADDIGHGRGRGRVDLEFVGPVVLVAEHDRIEARFLQRPQVIAHPFDKPRKAGIGIIERRAGQRAEMHHGDDRLCTPKNRRELAAHAGLAVDQSPPSGPGRMLVQGR